MFGLRAAARRFRDTLKAARSELATNDPAPDAVMMAVASALHRRECEGQTTTLRQLHLIADITQPKALRTIGELERLGLVEIERDMHDTLESRALLTDRMRSHLEQTTGKRAA